MVLSALSVIYLTTEATRATTQTTLMNSYSVLRDGDGEPSRSSASQVGRSLVNALVMVSVVTILTFGMVLLYKYRCLKLLSGYLMVGSLVLLATLTARRLTVALERYDIVTLDVLTVAVFVYNIAALGTVSIFFGSGIPSYVTQAYLIWTAVLVAGELSQLEDYTAWSLLVLLALYDLYAVLTPYGPLQCLVTLMQAPEAPALPGLLYEADVADGNGRRRRRRPPAPGEEEPRTAASDDDGTSRDSEEGAGTRQPAVTTTNQPDGRQGFAEESKEEEEEEAPIVGAAAAPSAADTEAVPASPERDEVPSSPVDLDDEVEIEWRAPSQRITMPLALAKLYRLPLEDNPQPAWLPGGRNHGDDVTYSVEELTSLVCALAPPRGGTIRPHAEQLEGAEIRYEILDARGQTRRVLFVGATNGRIFEIHNYNEVVAQRRQGLATPKRQSVRLGLGDFVFYSVLVSKAALYSWTTFVACTLAILTGLGMTLLTLAWTSKALPALPSSIFLGVAFYLCTRYFTQPWIEEVFKEGMYV
jgi:presenilin 1